MQRHAFICAPATQMTQPIVIPSPDLLLAQFLLEHLFAIGNLSLCSFYTAWAFDNSDTLSYLPRLPTRSTHPHLEAVLTLWRPVASGDLRKHLVSVVRAEMLSFDQYDRIKDATRRLWVVCFGRLGGIRADGLAVGP